MRRNSFNEGSPLLLLLLFLTLLSCTDFNKKSPSEFAPDNTGRNLRDTNPGPPTPESQKENEADLSVTQRIRQTIVADDSLSVDAKNVKIMTANGMVTLRGPVNTVQEKENIDAKAKQVAGVMKVDNQIEVKLTQPNH